MTQIEINNIINEIVRRIVERFHPEKIILFGSYARNESTEDSDFDILVVMPVENSQRQKANEIDLALADRTVPMDVIVVTPEQFECQKDLIGTIVHEAVREGRVIYTSGPRSSRKYGAGLRRRTTISATPINFFPQNA